MRRVFPLLLLLVTPLLVNCSDSATPVAAAGAVLSEGEVPTEEEAWPLDGDWWTPEDALMLAEEEISAADVNATANPNAVVVFGNVDLGTPYLPGAHDESVHAKNRIFPAAVSIKAGETVTFQGLMAHRLAIYNDGMKPQDILNLNPGAFVLYPNGRLYLQPTPTPQVTLKFVRPGKYLVICAIKTHFFGTNQWAWVTVV